MKVKGAFCWGRSLVSAGWGGLWRSSGPILANVAGAAGSGRGSLAEDRVEWCARRGKAARGEPLTESTLRPVAGACLAPCCSLLSLNAVCGGFVHSVALVFRNPVQDASCQNACIFITNTTNMRVSRTLPIEPQRSSWGICPFGAFVYGTHRTDLTNTESSVQWRTTPTVSFSKYRIPIAINVNDTQE